jgi:serine/threonine protein phosphatase PrpC
MTLTLRAAVRSDVGLVRENNEDAAYAGRRLFAIADGIGGLPAGELASDLVIQALMTLDEAGGDLQEAVLGANQRIKEVVEAHPEREGMGTTLTALVYTGGDSVTLLHIGDSRAYLLRDGELIQLTRDDTYVQSLVDHGVLTPEEARRHPQRSIVTQALQGEDVTPAFATLPAHLGDRYLLCSDGLSDYVTDDAIAAALREHADLDECAEALVKLTLQAGAPDNVSVVLAEVTT